MAGPVQRAHCGKYALGAGHDREQPLASHKRLHGRGMAAQKPKRSRFSDLEFDVISNPFFPFFVHRSMGIESQSSK